MYITLLKKVFCHFIINITLTYLYMCVLPLCMRVRVFVFVYVCICICVGILVYMRLCQFSPPPSRSHMWVP